MHISTGRLGRAPSVAAPRSQPFPGHPLACAVVVTMAAATPATLGGPTPGSTASPLVPVARAADVRGPPPAAAPRGGPATIRLVQYVAGAGAALSSLLSGAPCFFGMLPVLTGALRGFCAWLIGCHQLLTRPVMLLFPRGAWLA